MTKKRKWLDCFVPHRLEMLLHPTWRSAPVPLRRLIERLEIEHLRHGGYKNGELFVSFNQFVEAGISRRRLTSLLDLGEAFGLVRVIRAEGFVGDLRGPNAYRLTYLPAKGSETPTDEWKAISQERVLRLIDQYRDTDRSLERSGERNVA